MHSNFIPLCYSFPSSGIMLHVLLIAMILESVYELEIYFCRFYVNIQLKEGNSVKFIVTPLLCTVRFCFSRLDLSGMSSITRRWRRALAADVYLGSLRQQHNESHTVSQVNLLKKLRSQSGELILVLAVYFGVGTC